VWVGNVVGRRGEGEEGSDGFGDYYSDDRRRRDTP